MQKKFLKYCESIGVNPGSKILLAVSGGLDSMALLHLFRLSGFSIQVAHCNFKLRGEESDGDEAFVSQVCGVHGIPIHTKHFDTEDYANSKSISIQMAARDLRYAWFEELRLGNNLDSIATAHHQDDQIETLLINMSRGTGVKGMHGILARHNGLIRPLLFTDRIGLEVWMRDHGFVFREDSSNTSIKYARNKLRHQVIPVLKELNPSLSKTYKENAERFGNAAKNLAFFYEKQRNTLFVEFGDEYQIVLSELLKFPSPIDVLFYFIDAYGFNDWKAVENLMDSEPGKLVSSPTHDLLKDRDVFVLREKKAAQQQCFYIEKNQQFLTEPMAAHISVHDAKGFDLNRSPECAVLDFDKLEFPLVLRKWRKGDVFKPLGMRGKKKLSDFFIDQKMSLFEKQNVWLLCSSGEIIWIVGKRIDERFKLVETTQKVYLVQLNKE